MYIVPWREEAVPPSDWIKVPLPDAYPKFVGASPRGDFVYFFEGTKLKAIRFASQTGRFSEPYEVRFIAGSPATPRSDDDWEVRDPGLVFSRDETTSSIWLMRLPQ
jgi:hypothetical protein